MKRFASFALAAALLTGTAAGAQDLVRMSTLGPGSSPNLVMTTFATIVNQNSDGIEIQVNATGAAPRHAVEAATGRTDVFMYAPVIHNFMTKQAAMFADVEQAPAMAQELRAIMAFPIGVYHFTTVEGSGIENWEDIAGKRVYLGPPAAAATNVSTGLIRTLTGFEPDEDYEAVKLGWGAAAQAFQDGQLDLYTNPTNAPSPVIQQVALTSKLRFLGIPEERLEEEAIQAMFNRPGGAIGTIPAGVYGENQLNTDDVTTIRAIVGIGVGAHMSDDLVYEMTKTFWDNIEGARDGTPWLRAITLETAFEQMNLPLHAGALRYYEEAGLEIPDDLRPQN
ncbi:TAXI family TRAP transporter solute-binding subunit [Litoreibacter albidus]|uniref:TAXI family TRAP transporter solute-binding subunit n=1 Tax=Litoreibacter albidus TaxID=670155 RepID=UPI003735E2E5